MLNETFYIDGVDARNFGIYLQKPIEFSEARPVVEIQSIPGRNGDLVFETGSYENRTGIASCFCLQKDVEKAISAAGRFLMAKHGYRRLETSDDPDHFWLARIENSPAIAQRMKTLAPFEISFDCKPQRFLKSGEEKIVLDSNEFAEFFEVYNPFGFNARPLIHVEWESERSESANENDDSNVIIMKFSGSPETYVGVIHAKKIAGKDLYIDCDIHESYNDAGNQNRHIVSYNFPVLAPGKNYIETLLSFAVKKIEITPRWWEL